ncbi:uncharacterized protein DFL_003733 [Arthrobotrys flagrans]|uniref:Uncharacterized protein n=1 Tax=Arthrobotrys flagrans TaxID=97331 RepID=A0A437A2U7_ARTFL|nr:hypothetical protein DFL_003733 [Arthrobotrys flagrans]
MQQPRNLVALSRPNFPFLIALFYENRLFMASQHLTGREKAKRMVAGEEWSPDGEASGSQSAGVKNKKQRDRIQASEAFSLSSSD